MNDIEDKFIPCEAYPLCKHHKCDCYESYCMLPNSKKIVKEDKTEVSKITNIKDIKKLINKNNQKKSI